MGYNKCSTAPVWYKYTYKGPGIALRLVCQIFSSKNILKTLHLVKWWSFTWNTMWVHGYRAWKTCILGYVTWPVPVTSNCIYALWISGFFCQNAAQFVLVLCGLLFNRYVQIVVWYLWYWYLCNVILVCIRFHVISLSCDCIMKYIFVWLINY